MRSENEESGSAVKIHDGTAAMVPREFFLGAGTFRPLVPLPVHRKKVMQGSIAATFYTRRPRNVNRTNQVHGPTEIVDEGFATPTARRGAANWKLLAMGCAVALAAITVIAISAPTFLHLAESQPERLTNYLQPQSATHFDAAQLQATRSAGIADAMKDARPSLLASPPVSQTKNGPLTRNDTLSSTTGPMIARTAALTVLVRDFAAARGSLDSIVAKYGGYCANLTVDTPESGQRHFQASLRIPANELMPALTDLKTLGRALNETQTGEEVTQQHADLVARLQNSRETEERLRAILQQRTGKIEDVLQVEEEIARVRGEIESMDAEQKALEHRVTFASVDLQLVEEYKEQFNPTAISTSGRLHNAFVEGIRNASGTVLGLILFFEEFGPALLIWAGILGIPIYFVWRRYQRVRVRF